MNKTAEGFFEGMGNDVLTQFKSHVAGYGVPALFLGAIASIGVNTAASIRGNIEDKHRTKTKIPEEIIDITVPRKKSAASGAQIATYLTSAAAATLIPFGIGYKIMNKINDADKRRDLEGQIKAVKNDYAKMILSGIAPDKKTISRPTLTGYDLDPTTREAPDPVDDTDSIRIIEEKDLADKEKKRKKLDDVAGITKEASFSPSHAFLDMVFRSLPEYDFQKDANFTDWLGQKGDQALEFGGQVGGTAMALPVTLAAVSFVLGSNYSFKKEMEAEQLANEKAKIQPVRLPTKVRIRTEEEEPEAKIASMSSALMLSMQAGDRVGTRMSISTEELTALEEKARKEKEEQIRTSERNKQSPYEVLDENSYAVNAPEGRFEVDMLEGSKKDVTPAQRRKIMEMLMLSGS